ncbi:hypothetical protein T02_10630 [Trichinella nativa]|uniref:Uncharacterized protein n=1 Tax=Trichinella nativa TaxID=6335 RepID=A0A0V1LQH9_9BILA|nr:hypothetical protein T02_10630 [Trichinella nativa]
MDAFGIARSIHVVVLKFAICRGLVVGINYKKAHHHCHRHHPYSDMNMTEETLRGKGSVDLFFYLIALSQLACAYVNYLKCMEKCVSLFGSIDQEQSNARVETVKRHRWENSGDGRCKQKVTLHVLKRLRFCHLHASGG